jgi:subtilase-type serine protease
VNHVYRVVFNHALKCVQVVSEFARGGRAPTRSGARRAPPLALLSAAITLSCAAPAAQAVTSQWIGGVGDWTSPGNWIGGVPIDHGNDAPNDTGYVDTGTAIIDGVNAPDADEVHIARTGIAGLNILNGGSLDTNTLYMGTQAGSQSTVVIDGAGSQWSARYTIGVGHFGSGDLTIRNGGKMTIDIGSYIASMAGSNGIVRVQGIGSEWNNLVDLFAGQAGQGVIEVNAGGTLTSLNGYVGNLAGSTGRVTLTGVDSRWDNGGTLTVGNNGRGTLQILDGAHATSIGALSVGNGSGANGVLSVSGAGALLDARSTLVVGGNGIGRVEILDGGLARVQGSIQLGRSNAGNGTLSIGPSGQLNIGGALPASITTGSGTGVLELAGGTLRANSVLRVDSNVLLSADSTVETVNNVLMQRAFSGTGQLRKTGTAGLTVSADSSAWSGGTLVEAGTLAVYGSKALGTGRVTLDDTTRLELGDAVALDNSVQLRGQVAVSVGTGNSATLAGGVSGTAGSSLLVKTDGGRLVLGGNAFGGDVRVDDGRVLATGNALPTGNITIGSTGTFQIDTTRVLQYAGQLSGTGTFAQGRHWLTLSGDSSGFAGTTVVDGGRLMVDGALGGQVNLDNGAYLAGSGRVGSVHLRSGSVLDPGPNMGVGRLTVTGDLVFDASATYRVDVAADGSSDRVDVAGVATLGGAGTVAVAAAGDWKVSTRYTVLTAGDGVAGTFAGVSSNFAFLDPSLAYDANNVYLTMARNDVSMPDVQLAFPDVVVSDNQKAVAGAVEALGTGNAVYDAVVRLEVPQVVPAFDSLSGEVHAANRGALLQNRFLHDGIDRHLDGRAISGGIAPGVRVWLAGSGGQRQTDTTVANVGTRAQQHGLMAGAGWQVGESLQLGVAAGQQQLDTRLRERDARAETDATEYGVYADYGWMGLRLRGGVTRADYRTDSTRTAQIGTTFAETLSAREDATATTAFVRAGWTFGGPRLQLTPEIELAQVRLESDGSQEHGGHSALRIASSDSRYRTGLAALKADWDISGGLQDKAVLTARVGWQYADGDRLPTATARFVAGAQDFGISAAPLARSSVLAQLGVAVSPTANSRVSLQVQGRDGDGQRDVGAQLDWSVGF